MFKSGQLAVYVVDQSGKLQKPHGMLASLRGGRQIPVNLDSSDELIVAIRKALADENELSADEQTLIRSFVCSWLTGKSKGLGSVVAYAVELPASVQFIGRIGMLGRATQQMFSGTIAIAETALVLDMAWDVATGNMLPSPGELLVAAGTDILLEAVLPDALFAKIDSSYGKPGQPCPPTAFEPENVVSFLQLCQMYPISHSVHGDRELLQKLDALLMQRIDALFLSISRQVEGLVLSGAANASSAVVVHSALALGLHATKAKEMILDELERSLEKLDCVERAAEARNTLDGIRNSLNKDAATMERRIHRHLTSAMTTDAVNLATTPVTMTLELMSTVANGLQKVAGQKGSKVFGPVEQSFQLASSTVEKTPDVISYIIQGGLTSEEWTRGIARRVWPSKKKRGKRRTKIRARRN